VLGDNVKKAPFVYKLGINWGQVPSGCRLLSLYNLLCIVLVSMSVTYQPKKRKRARVHGFLKRSATPGGRATLKRRTQKGRTRKSV
jgi:large subunit ribosomal protein L34